MSDKPTPSIRLRYPEREASGLEVLLKEAEAFGAETHPVPPGLNAQASIEIFAWGTLAAWIAKPFLESFLKEAGKDSYTLFKAWLAKLVRHGRGMNVRTYTMGINGEPELVKKQYSRSLSVFFESRTGPVVQLVYRDQCNAEQWVQLEPLQGLSSSTTLPLLVVTRTTPSSTTAWAA